MAALLNRDKKEIRKEVCYQIVHQTDSPPSFCPYQKFLKTKRTETRTFFEERLKRFFQVHITPFYDEKKRLTGVVHFLTDLTDTIKAAERIDDLSRKCQLIANHFDGLLFISSEDHEIIFANKALNEYLGKEAVGEKCYQVFYNFDRACPWCKSAEVLAGKIRRHTFKSPKDNRWYYVTESPLPEDGKVSKLTLAVDITELKETEKELKKRETFLKVLNQIVYKFVKGKSWQNLLEEFSQISQILNVKRLYLFRKLEEENLYILRCGWPEEKCLPGCVISNKFLSKVSWTSGESLSGQLKDFAPLDPFFKDLELFVIWIPIFLEEYYWGFLGAEFSHPVEDFAREALKALAENLENVLTRHWIEELLIKERERLLVTLKSIADGVIVTNREGRIILMNRAAQELTGWAQAFAQGKPLNQALKLCYPSTDQPEDVLEPVFHFKRVFRPAQDFILFNREGRRLQIHLVAAPIKNAAGEIEGAVIVFRDITRYRLLNQEAYQREKLQALEVMAGGIAHDFNNLLMAIGGHLSLAKIYNKDLEKQARFLSRAEQALIKAQKLTERLLVFAKRGVPAKEVTDIAKIIRETVEFVLTGSNINFDLELPPDLWRVEVDEVQLAQVIQNLVLNAREAMPGGGTLLVKAENFLLTESTHLPLKPGPYVRLTVKDTGCGIPSPLLPKIFDPYFTTKEGGSGLGLSVVYSVISSHNGYIEVRSKEGAGTTFLIYLPAKETVCKAEEGREPQEVIPQVQPEKVKVLILDDEEEVREVLKGMLEFLGYEVETASSAEETIEKYRRAREKGHPFEVVILDFTLPGAQGTQVLATLRKLDPEVKAIITSGYADPLLVKEVEKWGARAFIKKPFRLEELVRTLNQIFGQSL